MLRLPTSLRRLEFTCWASRVSAMSVRPLTDTKYCLISLMRHFTKLSIISSWLFLVKKPSASESMVWMRISNFLISFTNGSFQFRPGSISSPWNSPNLNITARSYCLTVNRVACKAMAASAAMTANTIILFSILTTSTISVTTSRCILLRCWAFTSVVAPHRGLIRVFHDLV